MTEITVTTNRAAEVAGKALEIWRWEVPVYLFMGGLTAGIMIFAAYMVLKNKQKDFPVSTNRIILLAPVAISLGMVALFLDLSHKLYVWRFYTTFQVTSPMSWGSWILLLVYPASILLFLATVRAGFPAQYQAVKGWIERVKLLAWIVPLIEKLVAFAEQHKKTIALVNIPVGIVLGVYTGILLNTLVARPFWNSAVMGPLFLVSGASTGAALIIILSSTHKEREFFARIDVGLIVTELALIALFILGMLGSTGPAKDAIGLILGGPLTPAFWSLVILFGLSIPLLFEILEMKGYQIPGFLAASMVLVGGLALRFIIVEAGQLSRWLPY